MLAQTRGPGEPIPVANPEPGTVLTAPAGSQAQALFDFINEAPHVAAFHLEVEGLPSAEWSPGARPEEKQMAAAAGGGTLRLSLCPPSDTMIGDYPFRVSVVSDGAAVVGPVPLVLRVEPGAAPSRHDAAAPVEAEPPSPTAAESVAPEPDPAPPVATHAMETPPPPVTATDPVASAAATVTEPTPTAPITETRPAHRETVPVREVAQVRAVAQPVARTVPPPPRPTDGETPPPLVDVPDPEEEQEEVVTEPSLLDPRDGSVLSLRPGETLLLRFGFANDTRRERVYVIEEDRSLDSTWINIVQDQIHLMPNARSELSVRLSPPPNADPGAYPFQVRVGPTGGVLTPCSLTLEVSATPAVRLKADPALVQTGPFSRFVDFRLTVERAGNSDTAFRIAVTAPRTATDDGAATDAAAEARALPPVEEVEVYETARWRYLFDREMASLESPTHGRAPKPEPIRLRLQRKGTWWFGFRESHRVRVSAVPVTDRANGGKSGNTADLTAVRWRLLPLPGFVLAPLALCALVLVGGTANDLRVANATYEAPDGIHYVVAVPQNNVVKARLTWTAPWYALLRLTGGGESGGLARSPEEIRAVFTEASQRSVQREYRVTSPLGSSRSAKVRFVRARQDTPLKIDGAQRTEDGSYIMAVPADGVARLTLSNGAAQDNRINCWVAKRPGRGFQVLDLLDEFSLDPAARSGQPRVIKVRASQPGGPDELVFVTTDAAHSVITVKMVAAKK